MLSKADLTALAALYTKALGWDEVDVDPAEKRVTLRSCEQMITKTGKTVSEACQKLMEVLDQ